VHTHTHTHRGACVRVCVRVFVGGVSFNSPEEGKEMFSEYIYIYI
jgi:hypothetical protein